MFRKLIDRNVELSVGYRMPPREDSRRDPDRTFVDIYSRAKFVDIYSRAKSEDFHYLQSRHELVAKRKPRRIFLRTTQG